MSEIKLEIKDQEALLNLSIEFATTMLGNPALTGSLDELDEKKLIAKAISLAKQHLNQISAIALSESDYQEFAELIKNAINNGNPRKV